MTLTVNGTEASAVWGLPRQASYDGSESSYLSGWTKIVDLGPRPESREHEVIVTASNGAKTLKVRRSFSVVADQQAKPVDNYAAGTLRDFRKFGNAAVEFMIRHGLKPDHNVVEIGPGAGRLTVAVARYLTKGTLRAFDVDKSAVDFCNENIAARYPHASFVHQNVVKRVYNPRGDLIADVGVLPVEPESCDFAYCWSVFTHLVEPDFQTYLDEFARILRPNGMAIFSVFVKHPTLRGDFVPMGNGFWTTNLDKPEAAIAVEPDRLDVMTKGAGFNQVDIQRIAADSGPLSGQDLVVAVRGT